MAKKLVFLTVFAIQAACHPRTAVPSQEPASQPAYCASTQVLRSALLAYPHMFGGLNTESLGEITKAESHYGDEACRCAALAIQKTLIEYYETPPVGMSIDMCQFLGRVAVYLNETPPTCEPAPPTGPSAYYHRGQLL